MARITLPMLLCALTACSGTDSPPVKIDPPAAQSVAKPVTPALTDGERTELVAKATKGFKSERDKMEAITFYTAKSQPTLKPKFESYLSIPDGRPAIFRINAIYMGESWVFYDKIKVMADDQVVYEKEFRRSDIQRDNSGGTVWETADYVATAVDLVAIERIAAAKAATIRFAGRERREDHDLTKGELDRLRATLKAYKELAPLKS